MIANTHEIINLVKEGRASLPEVRQLFGRTGSNAVNIEEWEAYYNANSGELSESCYVRESAGGAIDAVGMLAYSSDGKILYCAQYTGGLNSTSVSPSVGTSLFEPYADSTILGVVFGSTFDGATYFVEQELKIVIAEKEAGA